MKPLYLAFFFLSTLTATTTASAQDTLYYDLSWHPCATAKASYYRTRSKTAEGWQVTDHWLNGRPQMTGLYADDSFKIRLGTFTWYDSTGAPDHRCSFVNNKENGVETRYYPNGTVRTTGNMRDDKVDGEWIGYYTSGKVSAKATYKAGEQLNGQFFNEDGTRNKTTKKFFAESEFPGGIPYWLRFLNKTLRYPDSAIDRQIEGTVVIAFKVASDGKASDFRVVQSVDKFLDAEALRVLRLSEQWEPAIVGGIYTDSYKMQPIIFKLTNN